MPPAVITIDADPARILALAKAISNIVESVVSSFGFVLNCSLGKSGVVLCLRGKSARATTLKVFRDGGGRIALYSCKKIHVADNCQHLGCIFDGRGSSTLEVCHRIREHGCELVPL